MLDLQRGPAAVGRSYAYLGWPLDEGAVAVDEDNGHVSPVASGRRTDLDSPALYAKPCTHGRRKRCADCAGGDRREWLGSCDELDPRD